jgi:hypothetical protein
MFIWNNLGTICDSNVGMIETPVINGTHKKTYFPFQSFLMTLEKSQNLLVICKNLVSKFPHVPLNGTPK